MSHNLVVFPTRGSRQGLPQGRSEHGQRAAAHISFRRVNASPSLGGKQLCGSATELICCFFDSHVFRRAGYATELASEDELRVTGWGLGEWDKAKILLIAEGVSPASHG